MPSYPLSQIVEVNQAINPQVVSVGAFSGSSVDCSGFSRAMIIVNVGDISTGGGIDAEIKESATAGGTYTAITGATMTELTDTTGDNKCVIFDVPVNADKRFIAVHGTAGTATVYAAGTAILYAGVNRPPTQGAAETNIA
jgi:hypothetical protein